MATHTSSLRWRFPLQCAVLPAQVVVTLEKLCLRLKCCPTLGETARLAMQRRDLLPKRPVEPFQKGSRDLLERNQICYQFRRRLLRARAEKKLQASDGIRAPFNFYHK